LAFTNDPTTDRGKVRLLIKDNAIGEDGPVSGPIHGTDFVFTDADIDAFLDLNGDDVWRASADACRSLAADGIGGALLVRLSGIDVDLKKIPEYWMALAARYQARSDNDDPVEYIDSYDHQISSFGEDESEYVGDIV